MKIVKNIAVKVWGIVLLLTLAFNGCKKDKDGWGEAEFEMKLAPDADSKQVSFNATLNGTISIDWGDGTTDEFSMDGQEHGFRHTYENLGWKTVSVKAMGLKYLFYSGGTSFVQEGILHELSLKNCPDLRHLVCPYQQLTELDVTNCKILEVLDCSVNQLSRLDVSRSQELSSLTCFSNRLKMIDVSKCLKLRWLNCSRNELTVLDVDDNQLLESLLFNNNFITSIDLGNNPKLFLLDCSNNQLQTLDVGKNTALRELEFNNNVLTSIDISKNKELWDCYCANNLFSTASLNQLFNDLPARQSSESRYAQITFSGNPGSDACNADIITGKGWRLKTGW